MTENNLKKLLKTHGIKSALLVKKSNLSVATIDRIVNNRSSFSAVTMVQVTNALNAVLAEQSHQNGTVSVQITDIFPDYSV